MNVSPNEEIARKTTEEEIPYAYTLLAYQKHFRMQNGEQAEEGMRKKTQRDLCYLMTSCTQFYSHLQTLKSCTLQKGAIVLSTQARLHPGTPLRAQQHFLHSPH